MHNVIRPNKIFSRQAYGGKAKLCKRPQYPPRVFDIRFDEEIEISGEAWCPMEGKGIPTDNHVLNVVGIKSRHRRRNGR